MLIPPRNAIQRCRVLLSELNIWVDANIRNDIAADTKCLYTQHEWYHKDAPIESQQETEETREQNNLHRRSSRARKRPRVLEL